jgi:CO/xanthine dehydrogenase Mo-binding subunit
VHHNDLGGALSEEIHFEDGRILNARFSQYQVPRFKDVPPIETILVNRLDLASAGAGETPMIAVPPAIANAVFDACSVRIRSMPIRGAALRHLGGVFSKSVSFTQPAFGFSPRMKRS